MKLRSSTAGRWRLYGHSGRNNGHEFQYFIAWIYICRSYTDLQNVFGDNVRSEIHWVWRSVGRRTALAEDFHGIKIHASHVTD